VSVVATFSITDIL